MRRPIRRVDANQAQIVLQLRKRYGDAITIVHLHTLGQGVPDLLIGFGGEWSLIELKCAGGAMTDDEAKFIEAANAPVRVCYWLDDVINAIDPRGKR